VYHKLQYHTIPKLLELKKQPLKLYLALCQYADIEIKPLTVNVEKVLDLCVDLC